MKERDFSTNSRDATSVVAKEEEEEEETQVKKMELELGLKITRTKDDVSSSTDFKVFGDSSSQHWFSRETESVFILTLHLKGFKKEGIEIEINKEGNRIMIRGRKEVEEMVMVKWVTWKKETEIKEFKKLFRIPEIVNLDKIKARFSQEDDTLTITMPKKVKGITGLKIEEEQEDEEEEEKDTETEPESEPEEEQEQEEVMPLPREEEEKEEEKPEEEDKIEEEEIVEEETRDEEEEREEVTEERGKVEENKNEKPKRKKRKKCCFPFVAGSTLLMSIIVFIIQLIQSRRK